MTSNSIRFSEYDIVEFILLVLLTLVFPIHLNSLSSIFSVNLSLGDPIVGVLIILLVGGVLGPQHFPSFSKQIILLILIAIASVLVSFLRFPDSTIFVKGLIGIIKLVASVSYFVATISLLQNNTDSKMSTLILCTLAISTVLSIWTIVQTIRGVYRPDAVFHNPNLYADYLLFSIFLSSGYLDENVAKREVIKKSSIVVSLALMTLSLLGTESRSGLGSLLIGLIFLIIFKYKHIKLRKWVVGAAAFLPLTVGLVLMTNQGIIPRFAALASIEATGGRFDRWNQSFDVLINTSLLGVGWGQHTQYISSSYALHNTMIEVLVETGIVGVVVLIMLWISVTRRGIQLFLTQNRTLSIYVTAFIVASVANSMFHNNINFRTFWIGIGILGALEIDVWRSDKTH
jgi:O-antigen ligase